MTPLVRNRDTALVLGVACWIAGAVLLRDAYEARARSRPKLWRLANAFT